MSDTNLQTTYIVCKEGICGGKPRIAGTRIKVQHLVIEHIHMGWSVEDIYEAHPHITRAQIHAALSYYYDHRNEIEQNIREDQEYAERMEREDRLERMRGNRR